MRRTQNLSSYISMFLVLTAGIGFMVAVVTYESLTVFINNVFFTLSEYNLAAIGAVGAFLMVVVFYLILKFRFTV